MTLRLAAASRSGHSAARHGAVLVFHPSGGDAHPVPPWSLDEMARADPAARPPRPRVRTRPARRLARAVRRRTGQPGCAAAGAQVTGQNGRGSAKQAVPRTAPSARTLSAYLHRRGTASGSAMGTFTVLGRASPCSLALIAAGSCERAAGSGGAKRPRSGAVGALDAAVRERIMAGGGKGANRRGSAVSVGAGVGLSCRGPG